MLRYYRKAKRPDIQLWWRDDDGNLINFTGATLEFKIGLLGKTAVFTKTSGISGAAGSGTQDSGTPNVTVGFTANELAVVPAGIWKYQVRDTVNDRFYIDDIEILDVIL